MFRGAEASGAFSEQTTMKTTTTLIAALAIGAVNAAGVGPLVDLGYAKYRGYYSPEYDLNIFKR